MTSLAWLIPAALFLGFLGVIAFMWALRSGQFEDLDGAAYRILEDDAPETRNIDDPPGDDEPSSGAGEPPRDQAV